MEKGKLYIIPIPISEDSLDKVLPNYNYTVVRELSFFVVEKIKTARQFLRKMDSQFPIDDSEFYEMDKHDGYQFDARVFEQIEAGNDMGLISEAGYPAIADPGSKLVAACHSRSIQVIPLVGPSSIFLALAASGLNGQGFSFNGYIPQKDPDRTKALKHFGDQIQKSNQAQIFIETPYRNRHFFEDAIKHLDQKLKLCVAFDVCGSNEKIQTKTIAEWKSHPFQFAKTPSVFIVGK